MKRGIKAEAKIRKIFIGILGEHAICKTAQWQNAPDFIFPKLRMGLEVKSTKNKKYYPHTHDREQFKELGEWKKYNLFQIQYCIVTRGQFEFLTFEEYAAKYLKKGKFKENNILKRCRQCPMRFKEKECFRFHTYLNVSKCPRYREIRGKLFI